MNADSDIAGPLSIGLALTRTINIPTNVSNKSDHGTQRKQRAVVIGDGDFLSNTYLGNGGNLKLGMNIVNWIAHDDMFITIPVKTSPDLTLELTATGKAIIAFGFLILLPAFLAGTGTVIWFRRRKR